MRASAPALRCSDRIEETGDQVQRLVHLEAGHVLPAEVRFGAALSGEVEHRLVDVQAGAAIAEIEEVPHVRAGTAGQVQVPPALVAEQLVQATHAVALRLVVDVGAHQVVIVGQVGVQRGGGHGRQGPAAKGAAWYPRPGPCRRKTGTGRRIAGGLQSKRGQSSAILHQQAIDATWTCFVSPPGRACPGCRGRPIPSRRTRLRSSTRTAASRSASRSAGARRVRSGTRRAGRRRGRCAGPRRGRCHSWRMPRHGPCDTGRSGSERVRAGARTVGSAARRTGNCRGRSGSSEGVPAFAKAASQAALATLVERLLRSRAVGAGVDVC